MFKTILMCVIAVLLSSCVMPDGTASPTKNSQSSVVFTVNGVNITGEELMKSPTIRQGFEQFLMLQGLMSLVASQGISVDKSTVDEKLAELKAELIENGQTFEGMMEQRGSNETEYRENLRIGLLWEQLLDSRLDYTDEDLLEMWEVAPARFNNEHARANGLTDTERDALTLEDVYDAVEEAYKNENFGIISQELQKEIIDGIDFKLTCVSDADERRYLEDAIINKKKSTYLAPEFPEVDGDSSDSAEADGESHTTAIEDTANPGSSSNDDSSSTVDGEDSVDDD